MNLPVNITKHKLLEVVYAISLIGVGVCAHGLWLSYHPEQVPKNTVYTTTYRLQGDVNQDKSVDALDISIINSNYGKHDVGWSGGDLNEDGVVDMLDLSICSHNQGTGNAKAQLI